MYGVAMAKLQEKISAIDEKYRKMAEEARKDLATEYANLEAEQEIWQTSLSRYDVNDVNEILGEVDATEVVEDPTDDNTDNTAVSEEAPAESKEEVVKELVEVAEAVVDETYPENNAPSAAEYPLTPEETLTPEERDIASLWPETGVAPAESEQEAIPVDESEEPIFEQAEGAPESEPIDLDFDGQAIEFPKEWN